jgi:hypothetical protein
LSAKCRGRAVRISLAAILLVAAVIRLHNIDFGLPSLWDDDEPFFLMFGLKLLKNQTLNPGWFGHPGTVTIYLIAACTAVVYGTGALLGQWAGAAQFVAAIYADPALVMVPQRMMIVVAGLVGIWLTYLIGRRIHSPTVGLIAAAIITLSPLHIDLSQIIRTDIQMSMFVLLAVYLALPLGEAYRRRSLIGSAALAGAACATKWPGMLILLVPIALLLSTSGTWAEKVRRIVLAMAVAVAALLIISPFIAIDFRTVLANVLVEGRPHHLSQTSSGLADTLAFYLLDVIPAALGWPIAMTAGVGGLIAVSGRWSARTSIPIVVPVLTFLALMCLQSIMWPRWAIPILPFLAIAAAIVLVSVMERVSQISRPTAVAVSGVIAILLFTPLAIGAWDGSAERSNDTRDMAIHWLAGHAPAGSSVAVETPALALLKGPWPLKYPLGDLGCIDPRAAMAGRIDYDDVSGATKKRININLATVPASKIATCRTDFIVVNELDRYVAEAPYYPNELANYRSLLAGMREVAVFAPMKGRSGGPVVRIFARGGRARDGTA